VTQNLETIAAVATAPGRGGVGIVRVSGPLSAAIAKTITLCELPAREAVYTAFRDAGGDIIDRGIAIHFPAPRSYTGDSVLELQAHGGPVVLDLLLSHCLQLGARLARPGEFTERAFLNGKLDLAQAEAVADLIESGSAAAARAATRSLEGEFSRQVHALVEQLIELRIYIEAALDFSEEEIDFLVSDEVSERIAKLESSFSELFRAAQQGELLRDGMTVVIVGAPNVGKSSLLNRLAGRDTAIVTPIAGTTRDVLREHIHIDGLPLHVVDTAGLRESDDPIEQEGIRRAREALKQADRVLLVHELGKPAPELDLGELPSGVGIDEVINKIDLFGKPPRQERESGREKIYLSAKQDLGVDLLREHLKACMGYDAAASGAFSARKRHLEALNHAQSRLEAGKEILSLGSTPELAAEEFRLAQRALEEITGEFTSDDLLGRIFSSFCIGK
jgi:tRNA modification GTPase